jgi:Domain of unknown function (DUF1707)/Domain of unknown function (DUF4190)
MADRSIVRASDADRERVADRLRQAATEGRLTAEELEERLHHAFSARTYGELDSVVADLPAGPVVVASTPQTSGMAIASIVMAALWMGGIGSLIGIVLGIMATQEVSRSRGRVTGRGLALGGIALGTLGVLGAAAMMVASVAAHMLGHPLHFHPLR